MAATSGYLPGGEAQQTGAVDRLNAGVQLTLVNYSENDKALAYDRMREHLHRWRGRRWAIES